METSLKGPLALLVICIALLALGYIGFLIFGMPSIGVAPSEEEFVPGPPSPEVVAQLEKSRGFEVLVSYTDGGFEPSEVRIKVGESVRFTNNSSRELWVAAAGTAENPVYPGMSDCGASSFDTCRALVPHEFWEFTFDEAGTWMFANNIDEGETGVVYVRVQ